MAFQQDQQLVQELLGLDILREVIGLNGEVAVKVRGGLGNGLAEEPIQKHQVFNPLRVVEDSLLILGLVEVKLAFVDAGSEVGPGTLLRTMLVESAQVGGYAGVEAANEVIEYFFLAADLFVGVVLDFEAVLFIDQFPDI